MMFLFIILKVAPRQAKQWDPRIHNTMAPTLINKRFFFFLLCQLAAPSPAPEKQPRPQGEIQSFPKVAAPNQWQKTSPAN